MASSAETATTANEGRSIPSMLFIGWPIGMRRQLHFVQTSGSARRSKLQQMTFSDQQTWPVVELVARRVQVETLMRQPKIREFLHSQWQIPLKNQSGAFNGVGTYCGNGGRNVGESQQTVTDLRSGVVRD